MRAEEHPEARARMVDVSAKAVTDRSATARGLVRMSEETLRRVLDRSLEKGDALEIARIAGIMAAKKTSELIPLCHPIGIDGIDVSLERHEHGVEVEVTVRSTQRTGVEMEALTAVAVAALTVYDMVKGIERGVRITDVRLVRKSGGRSGDYSVE